jgi:dihydroxyacid dehydratase/phosphogluconate dehydratase
MLHLRDLHLLDLEVGTVTGARLGDILDTWERSDRRRLFRERLKSRDGVSPEDVILPPPLAKARGLTSTVAFPRGNLAPEGSVIKSTAIDPTVIDSDGVYRFEGPARVFVRERDAITAIKHGDVKPGDVLVLMGAGPMGTGMEETYQLTSALKHLPWGRSVALITDARFSGVSTGACIGHIGPEALAGGPLGRLRDGDRIRIRIDCQNLDGSVDLVVESSDVADVEAGRTLLSQRNTHPQLVAHPDLPDDTRLWALLQAVSGGTWGGCVFDVDAIASRLKS